MGYRFRLHPKELPGTPDIVFPGRKKAIFVHGCYWHGHKCRKGQLPKSGLAYWGPKISGNRERDVRKEATLKELGWDVLTVWQCEISDAVATGDRLVDFLGPPKKTDRLWKCDSLTSATSSGTLVPQGLEVSE
jgi:DNA mismatch endonuclease (patch repair protein)